MFCLGRKWPRRTAQLATAGMLAASGSMFFASAAMAAAGGGNNGAVKLGSVGQPFTNSNDPHLTCPIQIQWDGFDPGTQTFSVDIAPTAPTGGTVAVTGAGTNGVPATFNNQPHVESYSLTFGGGATPNNKGEYHVGISVKTTATGGASDTKNKTVWVGNCGAGPAGGGTVALAGSCNSNSGNYEWTLTANQAAAVSGTYTPPGGVATNYTTSAGGTFSFNTGHNPGPVSFTAAGGYTPANSPQTAATVAACAGGGGGGAGGGGVTPPSASAVSSCGTASVHLDAGTNTTIFDITEPGGSHQATVNGGQKLDVTYSPKAGGTVTVSVAGAQLATATAPAQCGPAAAADPAVSAANHCVSGINLTLSNMNGTADTTFTVVDPDGKTHQVPVRAGQIQRMAFSVTEDTTGTVTASAPGLAKQTFTYKKNCASVLGIKHTRKPTHKPAVKPVVKGEKSQLPFTGFETKRAMLDGAGLFFLGAVLCAFGARRQEQQF